MSEKPKGPDANRPAVGRRRNEADAIDPSGSVNREKLKLNQARLRVGSDHKTDSMRKGRRGTYP